LVAAELSRRGYVALVTTRNTEGVDVLASNTSNGRAASIQVKTTAAKTKAPGDKNYWILNKKAESIRDRHLFYVFVVLKVIPEYYVVPSVTVADFVKENHRRWLAKKGLRGQPHKDTSMRIWIADERYREKWDLLGLDKRR